ncbi:MAG TPA: PLP-dependent transferase [Solirubrobacteraceae bacterium]|nr:PLP-dependent transferase [Solirubrobacteraceae bacterium]
MSGRSTRAVHAGLPPGADGQPFLPGPTFAAPYHLAGDASPSGYGRYVNPTWTSWEAALSEIEGGPALGFASGMAACTAILSVFPGPVVLPNDTYGVVAKAAALLGTDARFAASDPEALLALADGAGLVWIETPTNPSLTVIDIAAFAAEVHARGALLVVDGSLATSLAQPALSFGADVSVASDSKAMTGHSDLVLGHVACSSSEHAGSLRAWRDATGAIPGPFEAWLAHRSLATLGVRLERQCANALAIALAVSARGIPTLYPGLPSHPGHDVAVAQMGGLYGPVVSFVLAGAEEAQRFLSSCSLVAEATSFGGVHSSAERRARWGIEPVAEGFVRLSAGVEDTDDLVADVLGALDSL